MTEPEVIIEYSDFYSTTLERKVLMGITEYRENTDDYLLFVQYGEYLTCLPINSDPSEITLDHAKISKDVSTKPFAQYNSFNYYFAPFGEELVSCQS